TMAGVEGTFFRALAVTVATALLTSLALALTWTPTLSHFLLRRKKKGAHAEEPAALPPAEEASEAPAIVHEHVATTGLMGKVTRFYVKVLHFALDKWPVMLLGSAAFVAVSYFCYMR